MISPTEKLQIHNYLLSKQLPIDVLMEVSDHFEIQLKSLEQEKDISFNEAFILTQKAWEKDFRLVRKSFFSFGKVPVIVKEIQKETNRRLFKKSLLIAVITFLFQFITGKFLIEEYYYLFNVVIYALVNVLILGMISFYIFSRNNQQRTRAENYYYNQIINIFLMYILLGAFGAFTKLPTNSFKVIYDFVQGINSFSAEYYMAAVASTVFKTATTFYLLLMLDDRAKSIRKIKEYQSSSI